MIIGAFDESKAGHKEQYFLDRNISIDCRGDLRIDSSAQFGFECFICSASHNVDWLLGGDGAIQGRRIVVERNVWAASRVMLYNCWIREGCVLNLGSVVSGVIVPAFTMVAGNPAKAVASFIGGRWCCLVAPELLPKVDWSGLI
jgi:acetyltransferase-like isoleucine patch superfamily enzyme